MRIYKWISILLILLLIFPQHPACAETIKPIIKKSSLCEDASMNVFAFGPDDEATIKNIKEIFTPTDEKVVWVARVRGNFFSGDTSKFHVYWYGPDGKLVSKSIAKNAGISQLNVKATLMIENKKTGIYKMDAIINDYLVDCKYFKISDNPNDKIDDSEISMLEAAIDRPFIEYFGVANDPYAGKGSNSLKTKNIYTSYVYEGKNSKESESRCPVFNINVEEVTYRIDFKGRYMMQDCAVKWYAPDGHKLTGKDGKDEVSSTPNLKSRFQAGELEESHKKGLWKVECAKNSEIIDEAYFVIGDYDLSQLDNDDMVNFEQQIQERNKQKPTGHAEEKPIQTLEEFKRVRIEERITQDSGDISMPSEGPVLNKEHTDLEDELIYETNIIDELIYKKGMVYENQEITQYLNKIAERVGSHDSAKSNLQIKVRIIRDPLVNAFSMPNGSIYVHTGALARLENEAQLAFLLGHEMSHAVNKDAVFDTKSRQDKTVAYKLFDIVLSPTAVFFGIFGDLAQIGFGLLYASSVTGYRRDIEARADSDGILWASDQGYHPQKAASMLDIFLKEKERYQTGLEIYFLMDHPSNEWRQKQLANIISKKYGDQASGDVKEEEFLNNMAKIKLYNASLNIKMDRLEHAADNIRWVIKNFPENPDAHYLAGEIYRLKAEDKTKLKYELKTEGWKDLVRGREEGKLETYWREQAQEEYRLAIQSDSSYPDSYKGLGFLYRDQNDRTNAVQYFEKYLQLSPKAKDRRYITFLIKELKDGKTS